MNHRNLNPLAVVSSLCLLGLVVSACDRNSPPTPPGPTPAPAAPTATPTPPPVATPIPATPAPTPVAPPSAQAPAPALDLADSSSAGLTGKAWQASGAKNWDVAIAYADKTIELYGEQALQMQSATATAPTEKEQVFALWALNDVGTAYFLKATALESKGNKAAALEAYKYLADKLPMAQCYDAQGGWFWKPADAAREKVQKLEFDSL
jgi:tetratricopeptide (TPR) repeat protein